MSTYAPLFVVYLATAAAVALYVVSFVAPHLTARLTVDRFWRRRGRHRISWRAVLHALVAPVGAPALPQAPEPAAPDPEPTPTVDPTSSFLMAPVEMTVDDSGAENWGDLLRAMNTEERVIIHRETYELRQEMLAWERPALDAFNAAYDRAVAGWCDCPEHLHLDATDAPTSAWPLVYVAPLRDDERELVATSA